MGGGDLNMKKSWHPQRLDNVEKVWQKEEAQKAEKRRLEELRREIQEERNMEEMRKRGEDMGVITKSKDRLDWMYKGPDNNVNRDDYLLGKEIDKAVLAAPMAPPKEKAAGSSSVSTSNVAVDMAAKVREDPLFAIKKREIGSRKELLNNPIRMKQLQQLLKKDVSKKGKKKRKKEKKEKKKQKKKKQHKSKHQSESSSDSSSSDEDSRAHKTSHGRRRETEGSPPQRSSKHSSYSDHREGVQRHTGYGLIVKGNNRDEHHKRNRDSSDERERTHHNKHGSKHDMQHRHGNGEQSVERLKDSRSRRHSSSGDERHKQRVQTERRRSRSRSPQRRMPRSPVRRKQRHSRSRSHSPQQQRRKVSRNPSPKKQRRRRSRSSSQSSQSRSPSPKQKRQQRSPSPRQQKRRQRTPSPRQQRKPDRSPSPRQQRRRSRSPSSPPRREHHSQQGRGSSKKKMDAEEMARKRAEMMDNAKCRDEQRKERVMQYTAEEMAEKEEDLKKTKDAKFLKKLKLPTDSSVEARIKSNIHNIQRTRAALDKNFAKKY